MTDEERQKLCADLRELSATTHWRFAKFAADEIERLAANAQSDAKRIIELEAECGRLENELYEARAILCRVGYRWVRRLKIV